MHGTGIIRQKQAAPLHRRHEFPDRRCPGQNQGTRRQACSNLLAQTLFPFRPKNDHTDVLPWRFVDRSAESFRDLGKPFWQPAFGIAIG